MRAHEVFLQTKGEVTKAYYTELAAHGPRGELAVALFRALRRSQKPEGTGYRRVSRRRKEQFDYADAFEWAMRELVRVAVATTDVLRYDWGWSGGLLHFNLPTGYVRFTCLTNQFLAPAYLGVVGCTDILDSVSGGLFSLPIIQFCDWVADGCPDGSAGIPQRIIRPQEDLLK